MNLNFAYPLSYRYFRKEVKNVITRLSCFQGFILGLRTSLETLRWSNDNFGILRNTKALFCLKREPDHLFRDFLVSL